MKYRIINEEDILKPEVRKKILDDINGPESIQRKQLSQKRHEIYKDNTKKWVIEALAKQGLRRDTLQMMSDRASNISVCKKIVDKKAKCYAGGVKRTASNPGDQEKVDELAELLKLDFNNKKADRWRELHRNSMAQIVPVKNINESEDAGVDLYDILYRVLAPWQYDVVEDYYNHERPLVVILSEYVYKPKPIVFGQNNYSPAIVGAQQPNSMNTKTRPEGDGINQLIANNPYDDVTCQYIWWSKKFHFTTDDKGQFIKELSPDNNENPINKLPFVNIAQDQDGEFWADGGDDLIEGSVLINLVMTDILSIAFQQGFGQPVITGGPEINDNVITGPNNAIVLRQKDKEDPQPKFEFAQANPPLEQHAKALEQYVALLLSTNGLAPTNVANSINAAQFPSGISLLIENSELQGSIEDKQTLMSCVEEEAFEIIRNWQNYYFEAKGLTKEFNEIGKLADDTEIDITWNQTKPVITEGEKLDNYKKRLDLGISDKIDLIMMDNPGMTRDDAAKKLLEITQQRLQQMKLMMSAMPQPAQAAPGQPEAPSGEQPPKATTNAEVTPQLGKQGAAMTEQDAGGVDTIG